jgi:hypothetical protein
LKGKIMSVNKPTIFISHISEEAKLAAILKKHLTDDFLGLVNVFVSSDTASISAGSNWLDSVDSALRIACAELVICSKASVKRPWINFEAGAGWMRGIPIVPVCHSDLRPRDLSMPLSVLQSIEASQESGIDQIYTLVASNLGAAKPRANLAEIVEEIKAFETEYAPRLVETTKAETSREQAILNRMKETLREKRFTWRSIQTLAFKGGVTGGEALDILRNDPDVVLGKGKSGNQIAKLKGR